jgi:hypothetical protein
MLAAPHCADAHGIAGNRFFPGTLAFDDPAVADESRLPMFTSSKHPDDGGDVVDNRVSWSFFRLLTPTLGVGIDSGWVQRNWGSSQRSGFDTTSLSVKGELFRNDLHEMLVSAALAWDIGHSGAQGVGANGPDAIHPGIFFGKGFGDLPDSLAWLRPFAITGAAVMVEFPTQASSTAFGIDPITGVPGPISIRDVDTLLWGVSIQYSTYCLTNRFTGGPPKEEPLNQFVPLVEFHLAVRPKNRCHDVSGTRLCRGNLAGVGTTHRAAQSRSRTRCRRRDSAPSVPRRPHSGLVWQASFEWRMMNPKPIAHSSCGTARRRGSQTEATWRKGARARNQVARAGRTRRTLVPMLLPLLDKDLLFFHAAARVYVAVRNAGRCEDALV